MERQILASGNGKKRLLTATLAHALTLSTLGDYQCERRESGPRVKRSSISTKEFNKRKRHRKAAKKSKRCGW